MATTSEIRNKSQEIDDGIRIQTQNCTAAKTAFVNALTKLQAYPTQFNDYLTTVEGYTPTGSAETLQKDIKTQQEAEFTALKNAVQTVVTFLGTITEF